MAGQFVDIKVPSLGESVTQATVAKWLRSEGDQVKADEVLVELETEKVTLEVYAPVPGVLKAIKSKVGAVVEINGILGAIEEGAVSKVTSAAKESVAQTLKAEPISPPITQNLKTSPSVRKEASEKGIDLSQVQPHLPDRITNADLTNAQKPETKQDVAPTQPPPIDFDRTSVQRVKMTKIRQKIAERLKSAQNTAAILTTFNEVDMSAIYAFRSQYKDVFEKRHGVKLGFMSFFVKACVQALKEWPIINASIDGDEIVYHNRYDISVAVSAPQGLIVPVLRDADILSFVGIEKKIGELGQKAKDGRLMVEDLMGGTFTISNGGVFGSLLSTPILNPPQSAILGMHKVQERPVVIDGQIVVKPMMYMALSYDHRLIDGREAVSFLVRVKDYVEKPERLLIEV